MVTRPTLPVALLFLAAAIVTVFGQAGMTADQPASRASAKERRDRENRQAAVTKKASENLRRIAGKLDLTSAQQSKFKLLLTKRQREAAVAKFKTTRKNEIYEHAHNIVRETIPGMMQKFMPAYMSQKISAQRRRQKRRGPPSRSEIARIQKDARTKVEPAMRKTVMPALDKLTAARMNELLLDEKAMTRMLADRILAAGVLGETAAKEFSAELKKAGYPPSLTTGPDSVLNQRTKKMLKELDLRQIVRAAGL